MKKEERERLQRQRLEEMKKFETEICGEEAACIAGVDEAGRGPLAGPVVAAAVVLPRDFDVPGIDDSGYKRDCAGLGNRDCGSRKNRRDQYSAGR